MNTTEKTLLGTAAFAAGSAVGTFFAGRAAWRGINKARPIGVVVLAIVAYHSFDTYRASVDNAWNKVETVVERRAEASKAEAERQRLAELEAKARAEAAAKAKAEDAAEKARQAAYRTQKAYVLPASMNNEVCRADARYMDQIVRARDSGMSAAETKSIYKASIDDMNFDNPKQLQQFLFAMIDTAFVAPIPASLLVPAAYQSCMEDKNRHKRAASAKPKPKPAEQKPAPTSSEDKVAEARQQYAKATKIYNEVGGGEVAYKQWKEAKDNLARALMAN